MADSLYIVIPAYNEQDNIKEVVKDWYPIIEEYGDNSRLVVIDDGSKDATYKILKDMVADHPKLVPLTKPNAGHGATVLYGYKYALNHNADFIFQTDSDGQTLPSEFAPFWKNRNTYDMIVGYRSHRKDGFSRIVVTRVLRLVVSLCFHVFVLDANTPYRLMSSKSLKENMTFVPDDFFLANVALTAIYKKRKNKIHFIPITFRPRQGGVNSINLPKIAKIGVKSLTDFHAINKNLNSAKQ